MARTSPARTSATSPTDEPSARGDRRTRLLQVGVEIFAEHRYEDVAVSDIADRAGVAHGLLFHYFGSKRAFFFAVMENITTAALVEFEQNAVRDPGRWLRKELDIYLGQISADKPLFAMIVHGSLGAEEEVRRIFTQQRDAAAKRLMDRLAPERSSALLEMAVSSWVAAANELGLEWIERGGIPKARVRAVLVAMLNGTLEAVAATDRSARFDPERFAGA